MELKIIEEKENPLFNRKEINAVITLSANPKKEDIEKILSEKFSSPSENIEIKKIIGRFGSHDFKITANIYSSKEDKEKTESKKKSKKISVETKPAEEHKE